MRGVCVSGAPVLDYQRVDVMLDTKPKAKRRGDPVPPMTPLERMLGREVDPDSLDALDHMDNGKKVNLDLLLEVGTAAGRTYFDSAYPDPKFDLPEWRGA